jgi:putative peptidoglycan lipid II flippase
MQIIFRAGEALFPFFLAIWFGSNDKTDVYSFAWAVFTFAGSLVFTLFQDSALIPILAEVKLEDRASLPKVVGSILAHSWIVGGVLSVLIGLVAVGWFSLRYEGENLRVALQMVPVLCVFLLALATKTFFVAVLNADHRYFAQPVASSLGVLVTFSVMGAFRSKLGILAIPLGQLGGELLALGVLSWVSLRLLKMKVHLSFARPEPVVRFAKLVFAEVGGSAVTRINPVVDQLMAGLAGVAGGATLLRYSGDVASVPTSLLQATLLPVLLSHLAEDFAAGERERLKKSVHRALVVVMVLLLALAALFYLVRGPLLTLVFLHGAMDPAGVERLIRLLPYHLVGAAPFGALLVLARAHVAIKNSSIMIGMGALNAALNAGFNVVLVKAIGLEGIALSTSCVQAAIAVVFFVRFQRKMAS